jgi:hypothetical protein
MKTLLLSVILGLAFLPACKSSSKSASFSSGAKRARRPGGNFDRSKGADINGTAVGAKAVTKGSFTVWTVPSDPGPGEDYQIFIEVKLPQSLSSYQRGDLRGNVSGTDSYQQSFGDDSVSDCDAGSAGNQISTKSGDGESNAQDDFGLTGAKNKGLKLEGCDSGFEDFTFMPGRARLSVWVPGGDTKVRDKIDVNSSVLKEHQSIQIEF